VTDDFTSKLLSPRDEIVDELNSLNTIRFEETMRNKAVNQEIFTPIKTNQL